MIEWPTVLGNLEKRLSIVLGNGNGSLIYEIATSLTRGLGYVFLFFFFQYFLDADKRDFE